MLGDTSPDANASGNSPTADEVAALNRILHCNVSCDPRLGYHYSLAGEPINKSHHRSRSKPFFRLPEVIRLVMDVWRLERSWRQFQRKAMTRHREMYRMVLISGRLARFKQVIRRH